MKFKKILTSMTQTLLLSLGLLISLSMGLAIGYVGGLVKDQPILTQKEMKEQINNISKNSEVYFGGGEKLGTINSELIRKTVTYENLGDNVKNAIIASEDSNFYSNSGINIFAILRATHSEATGARTSGGSTITQQLVKNQHRLELDSPSRRVQTEKQALQYLAKKSERNITSTTCR